MKRSALDRRTFLRTTSAAAAGVALPYLIPSHVLGGPNRPGANEKVHVGVIGCGGRSRLIKEAADVKAFQVVAACDIFAPKLEGFVKELSNGAKWGAYQDFRKMFDCEKLDGVMVETTTHARAWIVIQAMLAGLDTYIEKPMCLTISEGRAMVNAARRLGRVTQVGTQQRSMPINNWASDLVKNGALGKIHTVLAPNFVGPFRWTKTSTKDIKGPVEHWWDVWTNQAELRPYDAANLQTGWAKWWDYDGGGLCFGVTGWGTHSYDQINRALGTDNTGPVEVTLEEPVADRETGKFAPRKTVGGVIVGDTGDVDTGTEYHSMAKLTGPRAKVTMKFANGTEVKFHLDGDHGPGLGAIFIGEKGKLEINRNKLGSNPKAIIRSPANPGPNKRPESAYHIENWVDCIKSRQRCNADIEIGQRSSTLCYLVNIARDVGQVGKPLKWDPVAERFTNCDEANKLLSRPRRAGYELPEVCQAQPGGPRRRVRRLQREG
jgi:predicted dehydrogenase